MKRLGVAVAMLSLLLPSVIHAQVQQKSPAEALRALLATNDLERRGSGPIRVGGSSTIWRFTLPTGRMAIEEWSLTLASPVPRPPTWQGHFAFTNGKFCLKADGEVQARCYAIEIVEESFPVQLRDDMAFIALAPISRQELQDYLAQDTNRKRKKP